MQENKTPVRIATWTVFSLLGVAVPIVVLLLVYLFIPSNESVAAIPATATSAKGYQEFLLMQIDPTDKDRPTLEAVWLMRVPYNSQTPFEVIIFSPSLFQEGNRLSPEKFKPYVSDIPNTIMAARSDISKVVDRLDGISVGGEIVDGKTVWKYLDAADKKTPNDLAIRQSAVVQGLLAKMVVKGKRFDLRALFVSDHPARGQDLLLEALLRYYPIQMESFRVRIAH